MCTGFPDVETHAARMPGRLGAMERHWRLRAAVNWLTLATPAGLLVAAAGRARVTPGPRGLLLAGGYRLPLPTSPAFTVGSVVVTRPPAEAILARPRLLAHEERHTWQYVACLGLPMLPLYGLAALWSYVKGGDPAVHNPFERLAGLADGGYPEADARSRRRWEAEVSRQRPARGDAASA